MISFWFYVKWIAAGVVMLPIATVVIDQAPMIVNVGSAGCPMHIFP